jgi:hypothetical protein
MVTLLTTGLTDWEYRPFPRAHSHRVSVNVL